MLKRYKRSSDSREETAADIFLKIKKEKEAGVTFKMLYVTIR